MWQIKASTEGFVLVRGDVELRLPATPLAFRVLHQVLLAENLDDGKIGRPSFPTQAQLDEMVEAFNKRKATQPLYIEELDL